MNLTFLRSVDLLHDERGIALPVALMGILALSVTVTAILLTASSEAALSSAHQDATRDVYVAQGGIEAYIGQAGMGLLPTENYRYVPPGVPAGEAAVNETLINVRLLGSMPHPVYSDWPHDSIFAITAQPYRNGRGGRTVTATARKATINLTLRNNVNAAIISGADLNIGGNTTVSDNTIAALCDKEGADWAIQIDEDNDVNKSGNPNIDGDVGELPSNVDAWLRDMIGASLTDLVNNATIHLTRTDFTGNVKITSFGQGQTRNVANRQDHQATKFNWGCPADLIRNGSPNQSNAWCESDLNLLGQPDTSDINHFPIVAIDASAANGGFGTVAMNLDHGQGILVVYNGDLDIQGQLAFAGLVIVEGNFKITGAGNNGARFEGAVIGLGKGGNGSSEVEEDPNVTGGTPTIRFNRCAIDKVLEIWNEEPRYTRVFPRSHSWFEVVR